MPKNEQYQRGADKIQQAKAQSREHETAEPTQVQQKDAPEKAPEPER
jgi:hypothetical protein